MSVFLNPQVVCSLFSDLDIEENVCDTGNSVVSWEMEIGLLKL